MKILLATPCSGGQVHYKYCQSLLHQAFLSPDRLQNIEKYDIALYHLGGYSGLGKDRGIMASMALRSGFDKIVFIDGDQSWTWPQLKAIIDSDKPIVAGVVALKKYPIQLNFVPNLEDRDCFEPERGRIMAKGLNRLIEKHKSNEIPVQGTGTAFMAIDVSVLKKLSEPGFDYSCPSFMFIEGATGKKVTCWDFFQSGVVEGLYIGEDFGFVFQAKRAGFQAYINGNVRVDHHGGHDYQIGNEIVSEG